MAAAMLAICPQVASAQAPGALTQLAAPNSCVQAPLESSECPTQGDGLFGTVDAAVSPDGQNVYVAGTNDDAIAVFARNPDGSLSVPNDCIADASDTEQSSCPNTTATGLVDPVAIAISPDGANVYVAATDTHGIGTIAEFARSPGGSLTQLASPNGCIAENSDQTDGVVSDCDDQTGHGLERPVALAVSPDGHSVYVADANGNAVAELTRSADGSLSQSGGADDCITEQNDENTDCTTSATGLGSVDAIAVSPDGQNVYSGSNTSPGTIAEFARGSDGALTQLASPNDCIQEQDDSNECGTETGRGLNNIVSLVVSPDEHNVYASSSGTAGSVAEFARGPDGALTQLASPNDCIEEQGSDEGCGSQNGHGLDGAAGVAVSPDGASVYVATAGDDCCDSAIAEFARNSDGTLTQLPSPDDCIAEFSEDCTNDAATGLGGGALAISPDGSNVYATGFDDIAELARTPVLHTLTVSLAGSGGGAVSDGTGAITCPSTCSHAYTANTEVTLTATPSSGSTFSGWTGACSGTGTCAVTTSSDMAVTATFTSVAPPTTGAPSPVLTGAPAAVTDSGGRFSGSVNPDGLATRAYFQYGLDKRYSQVGASGPNYTDQTPQQLVGSDFSTHSVGPVAVSGLVPNALYHVRLVAINSAGTTFGKDVTFTTDRASAPGTPTLGKTFNISPVSGLVLVYIHGHLVPLTQVQQFGPNVVIDTRHGTVNLTTSIGGGATASASAKRKKTKTQSGSFSGAVFRVHQSTGGSSKGLTTVMLTEGAFKGAPGQAICNTGAQAAKVSKKVIQLLHAHARGKFGSSGRYAAATVRGTVWTMTAQCGGTLIHDTTDSVVVTDFVRHKKIVLHPGQSYLAPGPHKRG
jgi:DNA-binding beta-propeller fold protein YncE